MKKIVSLFLFVVLSASVMNAQQNSTWDRSKRIPVNPFHSLIVKNSVTVMLIEDNGSDSVRIEGDKKFIDDVKVFQIGKSLIISGKDHNRLKKKGTIYIPVRGLKDLQVNSSAKIISYNTLQSPVLNLVINGTCTVDLLLNGKLNIRESEGYDFTYNRVSSKHPSL